MDTVEGGFEQAGEFPPQVPVANPGYKMVWFRQECWHYRSHKSPEPGRYNPLSGNSLFGHVVRLSDRTPAHRALKLAAEVCTGSWPNTTWRRTRGHTCQSWIQQIGDGTPYSRAEWSRWVVATDHYCLCATMMVMLSMGRTDGKKWQNSILLVYNKWHRWLNLTEQSINLAAAVCALVYIDSITQTTFLKLQPATYPVPHHENQTNCRNQPTSRKSAVVHCLSDVVGCTYLNDRDTTLNISIHAVHTV